MTWLSRNYDPSNVSMHGNFLAPSLHRFTFDSPLQTTRALPPIPPTSRQLVLQLASSIVIYDTVFFLFHLALHKLPWLNSIHSMHHRHGEINPQITNQLDIFERLALVMLANFSLTSSGRMFLQEHSSCQCLSGCWWIYIRAWIKSGDTISSCLRVGLLGVSGIAITTSTG